MEMTFSFFLSWFTHHEEVCRHKHQPGYILYPRSGGVVSNVTAMNAVRNGNQCQPVAMAAVTSPIETSSASPKQNSSLQHQGHYLSFYGWNLQEGRQMCVFSL